MLEKVVVTERRGNIGDGPPAFVPFSEVTSKRQYFHKPPEQPKNSASATQPPQKHTNQPKCDVKASFKQTNKPKTHHQHHFDKTCDNEMTSHRHTGDKPHQHHQGKQSQQRDRFEDRPFQGQPSKQRTHNANPQYKRSKGHTNDRSHGQPLSDFLPVTFNSNEEHFPALSHPTSHPQARFTTADDKQHQPPHKPILAWESHTSNTTTGGSIPFSAKRKT